MEKVKTCIFNIPICGGFCAPTRSPEESWLKHFSNEYTLPLAGVFMKLRQCLEINACCRRCGATGTGCGRANRRKLMIISFWISFTAWILNFIAAGALLSSARVVKATAWSSGDVELTGLLKGVSTRIWIGLKGRVDQVDCGDTVVCREFMSKHAHLMTQIEDGVFERYVSFDDDSICFSSLFEEGSKAVAGGPFAQRLEELANSMAASSKGMCEGCKDSATSTVSFVIMGLITQIPQMTTDLQRATRFGDVNCQATMGCVTSFWGTFSGIMSLASFSRACWRKFPESLPGLTGEILYDWRAGPGFICMLIATVLKLWDAFAHLSVPTPSARQTPPDEKVEELYDYLIMAEQELDEDSKTESDDDSESN